jgi:recombination protein U
MVINYPIKRDNSQKKINVHTSSNRGMSLENLINQANEFYLAHEIATIHKKPTPVQVVRVDYKTRSTAKIIEAYYSTPSTTDYNGVYDGYHIDFEAKQTKLAAFPLHNLHLHQIEHMEHVLKQRGICFTIISYTKFEKVFVIPAAEIIRLYRNNQFVQKKKPIPLALAEEIGFEVHTAGYPVLDYLATVTKYLSGVKGK